MSKKRDKKADAIRRRLALDKRRKAVKSDGDTTTVYTHPTEKGYNVGMIRDFLDHLLLEVRVQMFENVKALRKLNETNDPSSAIAAAKEPSPALVEQFVAFHRKYETALLPSGALDGEGATAEEVAAVMKAMLQANIKKRDEQLGHLEALQELFDEALLCAKIPFADSPGGGVIQPLRTVKVREFFPNRVEVPDYETFLPRFYDHPLTSPDEIEQLKRSKVVAAVIQLTDEHVVVFGFEEVRKAKESGQKDVEAFQIEVENRDEFEFLLSALVKFRGRHDFDGDIDALFQDQ